MKKKIADVTCLVAHFRKARSLEGLGFLYAWMAYSFFLGSQDGNLSVRDKGLNGVGARQNHQATVAENWSCVFTFESGKLVLCCMQTFELELFCHRMAILYNVMLAIQRPC